MPDDYFSMPPTRPARDGPSLKVLFGAVMLAFAGGAALVGYLLWDGKVTIRDDGFAIMSSEPGPTASASLAAPLPSATPSASPAATTASAGPAEQRIEMLEQRLARLDLQAAAAEGNAARAEGLLIAFAARRAVERGAPLGYLEDQLKLRFSAAQPAAVRTVIDAASRPVTIDQLLGQLDAMNAKLTDAPVNESGWQRLRREFSGLFVVRHDDTPSVDPARRMERARLMLRTGQVDAAVDEVARMPGATSAADWIEAARRYAGAERALDLIETTALLDPDKLRTASGRSVKQPSPAGPGPAVTPQGAF